MSEINIKKSIFPEDKEEFAWDEKALKDFKAMIKDEGMKCRMDDIFLLGFLRSRKFDLQRSMQQLKNYYETRLNYAQHFKNLIPSKMEQIVNANINWFLPSLDQDGNYIYIFKFENWNASVLNSSDVLRAIQLVMDFQLNFHRTQVKKIVCIVDSGGISLSHFLHLSPRFLVSMAMLILKDTYPMRYNAIHYVNLNIVMKAVLTVLIPLLSPKLQSRSHFHSDMKTLHKFINPEYLPVEFEGNLPSTQKDDYLNMIKANEELFRKNEEYVKLYEEEKKKNFSEGKFRYIKEDFENESVRKFVEKSEEKFKCYSEDPEKFVEALKQDSKFEFTKF